jgi:hypothetical protein
MRVQRYNKYQYRPDNQTPSVLGLLPYLLLDCDATGYHAFFAGDLK